MTREFIMTPEFDKHRKAIGLADKESKALQEELTIIPTKGDIIQGTGGLRKIRVAFDNRGKSGSARVCYVDFAAFEKIYLITAYTKNEKENLSKEERKSIKLLVEVLKNTTDRS